MTTLTMSLDAFRQLVRPVMPIVARETAVHALEGVRIRTEGGVVIAEAVSGSMLGMCVRPLADAPAGFDVLILSSELPTGMGGPYNMLGIEDTGRGSVIMEWSGPGAKTALAEYDVLDPQHFPNLRKKLLTALTLPNRCTSVNLNAAQLKAFSVCAEKANNPDDAPLVIHPGANTHDLALITCGLHFAGLATQSSPLLHQMTRTKLRAINPPAGDPLELWRTQLSTPEGE